MTIIGNTISYDLRSSSPGDAIRVLTGNNPVLATNPCEADDQTIVGTINGGAALDNGGEFIQLCDPIGPVGDNNFDSFDLYAFEEQQAVELDAPLAIDSMSVIDAGEIVSSYYVAFDPGASRDIVGKITFPGPIVGLTTSVDTLIPSDTLGNATAVYLNPGLRGLEGGDNAMFSGATLSIDFSADDLGDLNGDGVVNATDLGILRGMFFLPPGPSGFGDCVSDAP